MKPVHPQQAQPLVIAHRGASGYLPEHTLAAVAYAHAVGSDFIEQDLVLTKDHQAIVLHDIYLDTVTDVKDRFPNRANDDGRFYAADFTLAEIKTLRVNERIDVETSTNVYPNRFPQGKSDFHVPTFAEEIELIEGLNKSTSNETKKRNVGLYVEIKKPAWHRQRGLDVSKVVLEVLKQYGYESKTDNAIVESFDPQETKRIRNELGCELRITQLIASNDWNEADTDFEKMLTGEGLKEIATYADGIGPWINLIDLGKTASSNLDVVSIAHQQGLVVHGFTFRADDLPEGYDSFAALTERFVALGIDGMFTDFPDRTRQLVDSIATE